MFSKRFKQVVKMTVLLFIIGCASNAMADKNQKPKELPKLNGNTKPGITRVELKPKEVKPNKQVDMRGKIYQSFGKGSINKTGK